MLLSTKLKVFCVSISVFTCFLTYANDSFVGENFSYIEPNHSFQLVSMKNGRMQTQHIQNEVGTSLHVQRKHGHLDDVYYVQVINPDGSKLNDGEEFLIWRSSLENYFAFSEAVSEFDQVIDTLSEISEGRGIICGEAQAELPFSMGIDNIPQDGGAFVDWIANNLTGGEYRFGRSRPVRNSDLDGMCRDINFALNGEIPVDGGEGASNCSTASWIGFLLRMRQNHPQWIENNRSELGCRVSEDGSFAGWSKAYQKYITDFSGFVNKYIRDQGLGSLNTLTTRSLASTDEGLEAGDIVVLNRGRSPCGRNQPSGHAVIFEKMERVGNTSYLCYWSSQALSNSCDQTDPVAASQAGGSCCRYTTQATHEGYGRRCESLDRLNSVSVADVSW